MMCEFLERLQKDESDSPVRLQLAQLAAEKADLQAAKSGLETANSKLAAANKDLATANRKLEQDLALLKQQVIDLGPAAKSKEVSTGEDLNAWNEKASAKNKLSKSKEMPGKSKEASAKSVEAAIGQGEATGSRIIREVTAKVGDIPTTTKVAVKGGAAASNRGELPAASKNEGLPVPPAKSRSKDQLDIDVECASLQGNAAIVSKVAGNLSETSSASVVEVEEEEEVVYMSKKRRKVSSPSKSPSSR
jgi:hypothetical protein